MQPEFQPGRYLCKVVNQKFATSKTNNHPQFALEIQPLDDNPRNTTRIVYWTLTENTIDFVLRDWQQLGFTGTAFSQMYPHGNESFIGGEFEFECRHKPGFKNPAELVEE